MQRSNTFLLIAVLCGIAVMTVWRLTAEEIVPSPTGSTGPGGPAPRDTAPPPELGPDAPRVVVAVRAVERYVAPRPPRVQAVLLPERQPLPTTMLAGTGACPWSDSLRPGVALVRIEVDGAFAVRQVGVEPDEVSELGLGSLLSVTGRVQDLAGSPIAEARVWLGDLHADGRNNHLRTDESGRFEGRVRASDGVPLTVWAAGRAAMWRPIRVDVDSPREHTITLADGGELEFRVAAQAENIERGEAMIVPDGARGAELSRYPFFLQGMVGGAPIDSDGRGATRNLPRAGGLSVVVRHPQVALGRHQEVQLNGARTICTVPLRFEPAWYGSVTDADGLPAAGATLLLRPAGREVRPGSGLQLLPPELAATGCFFGRVDADGRFLLARPAAGDVVSVRAAGHAGRDLEIGDELPSAIELTRWRGGDLVLRVRPPVPDRAWRAEFDLGGGTIVDCAADAAAVIALPHAGVFDFTLTTFVGEVERGRGKQRGVAATGPVDIAAPEIE